AIEQAAETSPDAVRSACRALSAEIEREHRIAGLCAQVHLLEGAEQRLRDVFEAVELVVIAMDLDARMTYVNPFTERLSGWTRDELIGKRWLDVFQTGGDDFMEQLRGGDFPPHDKSSILLRSGARRDIEWANVGLYDDHGRLDGVVGVGRDVTDQLRVEREL